MLGYTIKRILQVIPVLLIISFICFMMIRLVPGDPVANMLGVNASKEAIAAQRAELGLDKPLLTQYGDFLVKALQGDLGKSITTRRPVIDEIAQRYPATLKLALGATVFAAVVGITFGVLSAVKQNKLTDNVIMVFSLLSVSTPSFFLALVMMLLFSIHLGWLPSMGLRTPLHYVLPIITLGMQSVGLIARTTRSSMLEVLRQDYIRTSRSRGISKAVLVMRHAFKNALIPVVTVVGLRFGGLLAGSMLVEAVFSVPGIGAEFVNSVSNRDYTLIMALTIFYGSFIIIANIVTDLITADMAPRIRLK